MKPRAPLDLEKVKKTSINVTQKLRKLRFTKPYIPSRPNSNCVVSDIDKFESTKETPALSTMFETDVDWKNFDTSANSRNGGIISAMDSLYTYNENTISDVMILAESK